jgi:hypothetical protein
MGHYMVYDIGSFNKARVRFQTSGSGSESESATQLLTLFFTLIFGLFSFFWIWILNQNTYRDLRTLIEWGTMHWIQI